MKLFGTLTSPYVRRVRIVASMNGAPIELVNTFTADGQAELRRASPIWKVPVLETEQGPIYDSRVITDYLLERFGTEGLREQRAGDRWQEANRISVIDGGLDAAINVFYLRRDGAKAEEVPYLQKQADRVTSAMTWLESQIEAGAFGPGSSLVGLAEIALVSSADWMRFRDAYPVERHPRIVALCERLAEYPAFRSTQPQE